MSCISRCKIERSPWFALRLGVPATGLSLLLGCTMQAWSPPAEAQDGADTTSINDIDQSIVGGNDDTHDPAVVALTTHGAVFCTGIVITPRLVLTAAHCAVHWPDEVRFGAEGKDQSVRVSTIMARRDFSEDTLDNDLGILVLSDRAATPAPIFASPDVATNWTGLSAHMVGFGVSSWNGADIGVKREGWTKVVDYDRTTLHLAAVPASSCSGDSGAPVFMDFGGGERLVGIISSGDRECRQFSRIMRIDAYLDFVSAAESAVLDRSLAGGQRCFHAGNCRNALCYEPADAPGFSYCSPDCASDSECPPSMACQAGRCLHSHPSPGAFGSDCESDEDCTTGQCVRPTGDVRGVCSVRCSPGGVTCPGQTSCQAAGDDFVCLPANDIRSFAIAAGGCQSARGAITFDYATVAWGTAWLALVLRNRQKRSIQHAREIKT